MIASGEHSFPSEPRRVCRRGVNRPGFAISFDFPHPVAQLGVVQRHTQQMIEQGSFIEGVDAARVLLVSRKSEPPPKTKKTAAFLGRRACLFWALEIAVICDRYLTGLCDPTWTAGRDFAIENGRNAGG